MSTLILVHATIGVLALLVLAFAALLHRGRRASTRPPRVTAAVVAVADRVAPPEAPPLGVLSSPEKARRAARRFEAAEWKVRRGARALGTLSRTGS